MIVCFKMASCALLVLVLSGCASAPAAPITVTKEAPAAVRTVTVAPTSELSTSSADDSPALTDPPVAITTEPGLTAEPVDNSWTMPSLVGQVLQVAQDKMQALTGDPMFYSSSTDAKGAGRMQILDSNWQVCSQSPAPGTNISADTPVSFGAVKLSESCP